MDDNGDVDGADDDDSQDDGDNRDDHQQFDQSEPKPRCLTLVHWFADRRLVRLTKRRKFFVVIGQR